MRIVFLDFDGVVCPGSYNRKESTNKIRSPEWYAEPMDRNCIRLLNQLVDKTKAKVIVSSAWRIGHTISELQNMLEAGGFNGEVIGKTRGGAGPRGDQISDWMEDGCDFFNLEPIESFVILDDGNDMDRLLPYLVRTDYQKGLTQNDVEKAIEILDPINFL